MHFDSGTVIYSTAEQDAEDLRKRGFTMGLLQEDPRASPWRQSNSNENQERIGEKLKVFRRPERGDDITE